MKLANDYMQLALTSVLAAAARGDIDLNQLAREELLKRGVNANGEWIGFEEARRIRLLERNG